MRLNKTIIKNETTAKEEFNKHHKLLTQKVNFRSKPFQKTNSLPNANPNGKHWTTRREDRNLEICISDSTVPNRRVGDEQSVRKEQSKETAEKNSDHDRDGNSRSATRLAFFSHQRPVSATSHGFPGVERRLEKLRMNPNFSNPIFLSLSWGKNRSAYETLVSP